MCPCSTAINLKQPMELKPNWDRLRPPRVTIQPRSGAENTAVLLMGTCPIMVHLRSVLAMLLREFLKLINVRAIHDPCPTTLYYPLLLEYDASLVFSCPKKTNHFTMLFYLSSGHRYFWLEKIFSCRSRTLMKLMVSDTNKRWCASFFLNHG